MLIPHIDYADDDDADDGTTQKNYCIRTHMTEFPVLLPAVVVVTVAAATTAVDAAAPSLVFCVCDFCIFSHYLTYRSICRLCLLFVKYCVLHIFSFSAINNGRDTPRFKRSSLFSIVFFR